MGHKTGPTMCPSPNRLMRKTIAIHRLLIQLTHWSYVWACSLGPPRAGTWVIWRSSEAHIFIVKISPNQSSYHLDLGPLSVIVRKSLARVSSWSNGIQSVCLGETPVSITLIGYVSKQLGLSKVGLATGHDIIGLHLSYCLYLEHANAVQ